MEYFMKYVSNYPLQELSSSDDDETSKSDLTSDAILDQINLGLEKIRNHARKELSKCSNEDLKNELKEKLESSTIGLIQNELVIKKTGFIATSVIDDIVTDDEMSESENEDESGNAIMTVARRSNGTHNVDKLRPKLPSINKMILDRKKMNELFDARMESYKDSLTKENLASHSKYVAFQNQISLAEQEIAKNEHKLMINGGSVSDFDKNGSGEVYEEESDEEDDSVVPLKDPISKKLLRDVRENKYCHHVFEKKSIWDFIDKNPGKSCPLYRCRNLRPLERSHFEKNEKLGKRIRACINNK